MQPKPKHLSPEYGAWFQDRGIIDAYHHRPPYPAQVFDILAGLIADTPKTVLDIGSGTGDIARPLAPRVERLDAVDISLGMIEKGRRLRGGDHPSLHWIHGSVEQAPLSRPYALITAGESLHWMDWEIVFPRFVDVLQPHRALALIERDWESAPALRERLRPIFARYGANHDFRPYDLIAELEDRGLFEKQGQVQTTPTPWQPRVDEYIECRHSQNGFSRDRMAQEDVAAFDAALRDLLRACVQEGTIEERDGRLQLEVTARVTWGTPRS